MAAFSVGVNWAGIVFNLDHDEIQQATKAGEDVSGALSAIAGPLPFPYNLALGIVAAYILINAAIVTLVDQGMVST